MKTPREILFLRHESADRKLEALRHEVVAQLQPLATARREPLSLHLVFTLWRELIWPCRRTWAAFAALWLLVLVVNVSLRDAGQFTLVTASPSTGIMTTWQQQERLLAELSEPHKPRVVTSPPKPAAPQPRSDRRDTSRRPVYA